MHGVYFSSSIRPLICPERRVAADSDVLLEITPIERANDIHYIVGRVRDRAQAILATHLHYDDRAINGFIVALSEVCQNIIEHSENKGFVGIQKYRFPKLNRNVVKIAVMDIGIGFRKSLSGRFKLAETSRPSKGPAPRRLPVRGRGQGARARCSPPFRRALGRKDLDPSGTAKLAIIPKWARGREQERGLTSTFPAPRSIYSAGSAGITDILRRHIKS